MLPMKKALLLVSFAVLLCPWCAMADDIVLIDGRAFKDAVVFSQTPATVTIKYADGLVAVGKELLPPELRARYPIDEAGLREEERKAELSRKAAKEQAAAAERQERAQKKREEQPLVREKTESAAAATEPGQYAEIERAVKERAFLYFKYEYNPGNSSATSWNTEVVISEVRPVEGAPGRWFVRGRALLKFYQSQGRTYLSENCNFEATYSKEGRKTNFDITLR